MSDLVPAADMAARRQPIFPGESAAYAKARTDLLAEEIELRRHLARVAEHRRALPPGPQIAKGYRFIDENGGEVGLADLFGGHDSLIVYSWMYGPERKRPCPMCTNLLGGLNGNATDIMQKAALKVVGRSAVERQLAFAQERGWRDLQFVQSVGDDFAKDIHALAPDGGEWPALVVFTDRQAPRLFWAAEMGGEMADPGQDPRGAPDLAPLWNMLDITPAGRAPDWYPKLSY